MSAETSFPTNPGSEFGTPPHTPDLRDAGPLGPLPRLDRRQVRLANRLARLDTALTAPIAWLTEALGIAPQLERPEVLWRASGLRRPGVITHLLWPRLGMRAGLGIEPTLAHAVVDRLLGFERFEAEAQQPITPVEWGILTFVVARLLERLAERPGPLGPWDLVIERMGADVFNPEGQGAFATIVWPVRLDRTTGLVRLWVPETLVALALADEPPPPESLDASQWMGRFAVAAGVWKAEAGSITLARGLKTLRAGGVLPIDGAPLHGTTATPVGPIVLVLRDRTHRFWFLADAVPNTGGARLSLATLLRRDPLPLEAVAVSPSASTDSGVPSAEVPVTLTVELGRVSIPLSRLADLKPGDVLELSRHAREPVELTSGGKLVARGELVQIDTELGVRVLNVFL